MPEKKEKQMPYDTLTDEQKREPMPYYQHDIEMARVSLQAKRWFIMSLILLLLFVGTNAAWMIYENQFEDISVTQENEDGYNNYIGNDGDIYNGESKTDNQDPQEESGR